ncbi:MAG: hypothetical protein VX737_02210 [Pseudomonadota bacterium]|nr:hypothetical protein [Pseudomonadota bacterium]
MGIRKVNYLLLLFGFVVSLNLDLLAQDSSQAVNDVSFDKNIGEVKMRKRCGFTDRLLFRCASKSRSISNTQDDYRSRNLVMADSGVSLSQGNGSQNTVDAKSKDSMVVDSNVSSSQKKVKGNAVAVKPKNSMAAGSAGEEDAVKKSQSPDYLNESAGGNVNIKKHCPFWKRWFFSCEDNAVPLAHLDNIEISGGDDDKGGKLAYRGKSKRFSQVVCSGGLSILLDPNGPEGQVRARSHYVDYRDFGGVLELNGEHEDGYDVVISGRKLVGQIQSVTLNGSCSLEGHGLSQSKWHLNSRTTGDVVLRGVFKQCAITQTGDNRVDLYWVGSDDVDVYSESGVMRLAGAVKKSRIRSLGNSQLLLTQLRAEDGWLSASDDAYVEMFGSKRFIVFMGGQSQVLSEGVPLLVSEFSEDQSMFVIDD